MLTRKRKRKEGMSEKIPLTDFGEIIIRNALSLSSVTKEEEVSNLYSDAVNGIRPAGMFNSMMGQSLPESETSLRRTGENKIEVNNSITTVSSHTTLLDIDNKIRDAGLELPISPDHRSLSVGGVLSVGGYDPMSLRRGALVDWVRSLRVIDTDGNIFDTNDKQFLCTLGRNGFIWDARIQLSPFSNTVYFETLDVDYKNFIKMIPDIVDNQDIVGAHFSQDDGASALEIIGPKTKSSKSVSDYRAHRKTVTDDWVFRYANAFRPWSDSFIPIEEGQDFFKFCLNEISTWNVPRGSWSIFSIICKNGDRDHFPHSIGKSHALGIGIYVNVPLDQRSQMIKIVDSQFKISDQVKSIGGKSCLHGWSRPSQNCDKSSYEILKLLGM